MADQPQPPQAALHAKAYEDAPVEDAAVLRERLRSVDARIEHFINNMIDLKQEVSETVRQVEQLTEARERTAGKLLAEGERRERLEQELAAARASLAAGGGGSAAATTSADQLPEQVERQRAMAVLQGENARLRQQLADAKAQWQGESAARLQQELAAARASAATGGGEGAAAVPSEGELPAADAAAVEPPVVEAAAGAAPLPAAAAVEQPLAVDAPNVAAAPDACTMVLQRVKAKLLALPTSGAELTPMQNELVETAGLMAHNNSALAVVAFHLGTCRTTPERRDALKWLEDRITSPPASFELLRAPSYNTLVNDLKARINQVVEGERRVVLKQELDAVVTKSQSKPPSEPRLTKLDVLDWAATYAEELGVAGMDVQGA